MARKPRIYFPGAVYHVMLRGNGGMQIFFHNEDRRYFYHLIEEGIKKYDYEIHAFCLMSNHVHLLLRAGEVCLSKIIQNVSFRYTRWINKRLNRIGHLFQGRYKAILIDEESYLLELVRYIHLNPVRAKMIEKVHDYHWCSHRVYVGMDELSWLSTDWVLRRFAVERISAISHYKQFIMQDYDQSSKKEFQKGNQRGFDILCDEKFMERIAKNATQSRVDLEYLIRIICDYYKVDVSELKGISRSRINARVRAIIAILGSELSKSTFTGIASYFKRDVSGIIRTIKCIRNDLAVNGELSKIRSLINKSISQA